MEPEPLVTVIVPAYNAAGFLGDALESVLNQTYRNLDILVVNDGSTDDTKGVAESFASRGVRTIHQANMGVAGVRNTGIRNARGKFIAFLDADDTYLPEKIEKEVRFLQAHPEFDLVYCNMHHYYEDTPGVLLQHQGPFYSGDVFEKLLDRFFGQLDTVLFPKEAFDEVGLYDETSAHSEEWDLHLRLARAGYRFGFLDESLVRIRISKTSWSRYENQWAVKEHNVEVFQRLIASMSQEERTKYRMSARMERLKFQLAACYLIAGKKKEFAAAFLESTSNPIAKIFYCLAIGILYLVPASWISWTLKKLWDFKRRNLFRKAQ